MRRIVIALTLVLFAMLVPNPAGAGGWAVGTLDDASPALQAGTRTAVGYTIRQHGRTPVDLDGTGIRVRSLATGEMREFPGRRSGAVGHYVADVVVPVAGEWAWELDMAEFHLQPLGTVTISGASVPASPAARARPPEAISTAADDAPAWRRIGLPLLAAVAVGVFASQVFLILRKRRGLPVPASQ
jgi:hypothetical protein